MRPELVAEVQHAGWSGAGRLRHAVFLGLREDKPASEVVRDVPDPDVPRVTLGPRGPAVVTARPPAKRATASAKPGAAAAPNQGAVKLTHPDRELWPGITKQMLADYWAAVAPVALPGIARRPLALVRCVDGADGAHFFQKHAMKGMQRPVPRGRPGWRAVPGLRRRGRPARRRADGRPGAA